MNNAHGPLTEHMINIENHCKENDLTISDLVRIFGEEGHYVLILFLVLPFLQPVPMFGLSTIFGVLMGTVSILAYLKKPPFVPKSWQNKKLKKDIVIRIAEISEKFFSKIDKLLKRRQLLFFSEPFKTINTATIVLNSFLLALPIPLPFSNTLPAWVIFFQAVAYLHKDGVLIIVSYVQAIICLLFFTLIGYGASTGVLFIDQWIKTLN